MLLTTKLKCIKKTLRIAMSWLILRVLYIFKDKIKIKNWVHIQDFATYTVLLEYDKRSYNIFLVECIILCLCFPCSRKQWKSSIGSAIKGTQQNFYYTKIHLPYSPSLTSPCSVNKIFPPLMSLWTLKIECKYSSPYT